MSTGDTKQITVSVSPSTVTVTTSFNNALNSNPDSSCAVSLSIPGASGQGSLNSNVTASPAGCSGVFQATAFASIVQSGNSTTINVPPQVLIQMMVGEAGGQNNSAQLSVGLVVRNRFGNSQYFSGSTTYQNTIVSSQFNGIATSITTGVEPELDNSVGVWLRQVVDFTGGSGCFWSPTLSQWQVVQAALNSGTTTFPSGTGAPCGYSSVSGFGPRIVF